MSSSERGLGDRGERVVVPEGQIVSSTAGKKLEGLRHLSGVKAPDTLSFDHKNWLIHQHYIRKDFEACKALANEVLNATGERCEYAIYILGLIARQEGKIQSSLDLFQKSLRLNSYNPCSLKEEARSYFLLGRYERALEAYNSAILHSPSDWELLLKQSVCYIHLKRLDEAITKLKEAIAVSPQTVIYKQLGKVYLLKGEVSDAVETYKKAIRQSPEDSDLHSTLGLLYLKAGSTQKAFESLGNALTYDPSNFKAILAAGASMQEHGDYDVALSKYKIAVEEKPESPQLWNNIAMCFFSKAKYIPAVSCLKRASYLAPFEWKISYNLGLVHLVLKQYASAHHFLVAAYQNCAFQKCKCARICMLLAYVYSYLGDNELAGEMFKEAITIDQEDPLIFLNYAILLYNTGEKKNAVKHLGQYESISSEKVPKEDESRKVASQLSVSLQVGEVKPAPSNPEKDADSGSDDYEEPLDTIKSR